jgi:hypothetical protein
VIVQHWSKDSPNDNDGVIPDQTSLYNSLTNAQKREKYKQEPLPNVLQTDSKQITFILSENIQHRLELEEESNKKLNEVKKEFFKVPEHFRD